MKHYFLVVVVFFSSCQKPENNGHSVKNKIEIIEKKNVINEDTCELEKQFIASNLIDIHSLDSSIRVSLLYATNQNFLNKTIYQGLLKAYLPCDVAIQLANAQLYLHEFFPNYHLIVFDATRPLSCQKMMWDELKMTPLEKINYLAHPDDISLHNYGAAVDVGIISDNQLLLDMGTVFDSFEELSQPKNETFFYKTGKLSKQVYANRLLLRKVMLQAGFTTIASEWWHFNAVNKFIAAKKYQLIK